MTHGMGEICLFECQDAPPSSDEDVTDVSDNLVTDVSSDSVTDASDDEHVWGMRKWGSSEIDDFLSYRVDCRLRDIDIRLREIDSLLQSGISGYVMVNMF